MLKKKQCCFSKPRKVFIVVSQELEKSCSWAQKQQLFSSTNTVSCVRKCVKQDKRERENVRVRKTRTGHKNIIRKHTSAARNPHCQIPNPSCCKHIFFYEWILNSLFPYRETVVIILKNRTN